MKLLNESSKLNERRLPSLIPVLEATRPFLGVPREYKEVARHRLCALPPRRHLAVRDEIIPRLSRALRHVSLRVRIPCCQERQKKESQEMYVDIY